MHRSVKSKFKNVWKCKFLITEVFNNKYEFSIIEIFEIKFECCINKVSICESGVQ